jgi:molybdopterin-guanine dinucleotide biosynthesis protein A
MTAQLAGVVLAGGGSRRMGRDKATIVVAGQRLVDRAVAVLGQCCDDVMVAAGSRPLAVAGARSISDAPSGEGPLAGIVGALGAASAPLLAVIAVDMPNASAPVLQALAGVWDGEPAVVPDVGGHLQPLHAVYAVAWTARLAALLAAGERSPQAALTALGARIAGLEVWGGLDPTGSFATNVNLPQDLAGFDQPR